MTKPITIQRVSGAMRKARIEASTSSSTRIRGWRDYTSGVVVCRGADENIILVYWNHANHYTKPSELYWANRAKRISAALADAGIKHSPVEGRNAYFTVEVNQ